MCMKFSLVITFRFFATSLPGLRLAILMAGMVQAPFTSTLIAAEKAIAQTLLVQAKSAFAEGKRDEAMTLASKAIEAEPKNPACYFLRAILHEKNHESTKALGDYDQVLN